MTPAKRAFLQAFVDENLEKAQACWDEIDDPRAKFETYLKAAEFVHPKLGRQELTGKDGEPLRAVLKIEET